MNSFDCCYHAISDISAGPDLMKKCADVFCENLFEENRHKRFCSDKCKHRTNHRLLPPEVKAERMDKFKQHLKEHPTTKAAQAGYAKAHKDRQYKNGKLPAYMYT